MWELYLWPGHVFSSRAAHCCSMSGNTVVLARLLAQKQARPLETRTNAKISYQSAEFEIEFDKKKIRKN